MRSLVGRWFVEYNPLYFASAGCLLAGVFVLSGELPRELFGSKLLIAGVTEAYQVALIGAAWLLLRVRQIRPAVLLGLLAFLFVLDVAFNGERILSHVGTLSLEPGMRARKAVPASLLLAACGPLKVWLLARVFGVRRDGALVAVAAWTTALLPLLPYAIELAGPFAKHRQAAHLAVFWLSAPLLAWAASRRAAAWVGDATADARAARLAVAVPLLIPALFAVHGAAWTALPDLAFSPAHLAPHLLAVAAAWSRARRLDPIAIGGAAAAVFVAVAGPPAAGLWPAGAVALMSAAALAWRAPAPAVLAAFAGVWLLDGRPPGPAGLAALTTALLLVALRRRDLPALAGSAVAAGAATTAFAGSWDLLPFGLLAAGVWMACWGWLIFRDRPLLALAAASGAVGVGAAFAWSALEVYGPALAACSCAALSAGAVLRRRDFLVAGGAGLSSLGAAAHGLWVPSLESHVGLLLVAAGFLLLAAGVVCNLLGARRRTTRIVPPPALSGEDAEGDLLPDAGGEQGAAVP